MNGCRFSCCFEGHGPACGRREGRDNSMETRVQNAVLRSVGYSSREKAFYRVVPSNTQEFSFAPEGGAFDVARLGQTDVGSLVYPRKSFRELGEVSLAEVVASAVRKMGSMSEGGKDLGTCALIAENLALVTRHSIEGRDVRGIHVSFGYSGPEEIAGSTMFDYVIEEDVESDYAIVKLKDPLGRRLGYMPLDIGGVVDTEPALLHYPLGKTLKVSVHTFVQTQYASSHLQTFHDSDYLSSGGAYINPAGRMVALHLGSQMEGDTMNVMRFARPLGDIVERNPNSILRQLASGEFLQKRSYISEAGQVYLAPAPQNYLIDEEGYESEKILRKLLKSHVGVDKKIKLTGMGRISFAKNNLAYIASKYPHQYRSFVSQCVGHVGLHGATKQYSVYGVIESDHTLPYGVWKSTKNPTMKNLIAGGGSRPGENDLPAITIPYAKHRLLRTTGSSQAAVAFRKDLVTLCDQGKVDRALSRCFQEYAANGVKLKDYKKPITCSLSEYVRIGVITGRQKQSIIRNLF